MLHMEKKNIGYIARVHLDIYLFLGKNLTCVQNDSQFL